jgi:hypothetical protein
LTLRPLTFEFDLLFKNFNLSYNFWLVGGKAFIFHMCIAYGETFQLIPWPWPSELWSWSWTYFSKTLTLVITFWLVGGRAFIFQVCIPSGKTFHLIPWPDPLVFDLVFEKFDLGYEHMQSTFFECTALLKFLMRQKKQCHWNLWLGPIWLSQSSSFSWDWDWFSVPNVNFIGKKSLTTLAAKQISSP